MKFTVGVLANNTCGVLSRITAIYSKRGCNIESLSVGETETEGFSRITVLSDANDYLVNQIVGQIEKLHDVVEVMLFDEEKSLSREHVFIKLSVSEETKYQVISKVNGLGGKIIGFGEDYMTFEVSNNHERVSCVIEEFKSHGIIEVSRSGITAVAYSKEHALTTEEC